MQNVRSVAAAGECPLTLGIVRVLQSTTEAAAAGVLGAESGDPLIEPFRDPEVFRISQVVAAATCRPSNQTPLLAPGSVLPPLW